MKAIGAGVAAMAMLAAAHSPAMARTENISVHGNSLDGNLEGNAAARDAFVYLPPSYDEDSAKRYPVVYFLHGYFATAKLYEDLVKFQEVVDEAAAAGNELIVVMADVHTKQKGSMYSTSATTGDFVGFVAKDLVGYIDANYRTIAESESRGLSGHSMGGYGVFKVAMKYPDTFSSLYTMAACCFLPRELTVEELRTANAMSPEDMAAAEMSDAGSLAVLSAWAPDPSNAPNYFDNGITEDGKVDPLTQARFHANSPMVLLPQYVPELRALEAIAMDVGDQDFLLLDNTAMHNELTKFGVRHSWDVFEGDHGNRVAGRIRTHLLPFFGEHLDEDSE